MKEAINNHKIPAHWQLKKLGEVGNCVTGNTPPKNDSSNYGDEVPFIKPPQLTDRIVFDAPEKLSLKGSKKSRLVPPNSVLVTCIGNLGRTAINKIPVAFNQQINAIVPNEKLDGRFLFYQAQSPFFKNQLEGLSAATTVAIVNKGKFETIKVVVPPLPEQQAIVAKIEELLSELDNGKQQLLNAQQQLKVYRQSLLKWAFEGKLTNKNVKDGELPKGWKWVKLGSIATKITDGEHITPRRTSSGFLLLSARNIQNGYLALDNVDYVPDDEYTRIVKRCNPEPGDILISCSGTIGRVCRVPKDLKFVMVRSVALVKFDWSTNSSKFYEYLFQSPILQRHIEKSKKATAQANLFLGPIKNLDVIVCSLEEQEQIVSELESKLMVCDKIEETISQSLQQAETLKQSILKKAFEGKLVNTEKNDSYK